MNHSLYLYFLLSLFITTVFGFKERNRASCALVDSIIYCYGGGAERMPDPTLFNDHFTLDLQSYFETNKPVDKYTATISPKINYALEKRWGQTSCTVLSGSDSGYVITMGSGNDGTLKNDLQNKTILYTPTTRPGQL
ncbi:hypothetical protein BCR42DRAFT_392223 [Absidia repens]|uniref:Uncharacterized protein n=1 Tax=Absidia repens TaxID=90262 RepID=A0A1X2IGM1_9FUNG|nr:hypothetical protein BCR42DRAFT_392223 [Absidia repens]